MHTNCCVCSLAPAGVIWITRFCSEARHEDSPMTHEIRGARSFLRHAETCPIKVRRKLRNRGRFPAGSKAMQAHLDEQSVIKANAQFWEQMLAMS